jgi:hypothetical protein
MENIQLSYLKTLLFVWDDFFLMFFLISNGKKISKDLPEE